MPLYADDPMFMRLVLDSFDHSIGSKRGDAQATAQIPDGLVVRSIDLDIEPAVTFSKAGNGCKLGDFASRLDSRGMYGIGCVRREAFLAVLDASVQFAGNVLVKSTAEADVEALASIANGKNRFGGGEGVVDDGEIGFFAVYVSIVRFWVARRAVKRRIYVRGGARENEGVQISYLCGELIWRKLERHVDGPSLGGDDGGEVILKLVRDAIGLFVRSPPRNAHTGAASVALLRTSRCHGTPNRSIPMRGRQPEETGAGSRWDTALPID